jgi:hypothetical protein
MVPTPAGPKWKTQKQSCAAEKAQVQVRLPKAKARAATFPGRTAKSHLKMNL